VTANSVKAKVMLEKRIKHQRIILKQKALDTTTENQAAAFDQVEDPAREPQEQADEDMVQEAFSTVIAQKKRTSQKPFDPNQPKKKKVKATTTKDEENYINYVSKDYQTETG